MAFERINYTTEQILHDANPEQRLIWNYLFLTFGENLAIRQFNFYGSLIGSPLLVNLTRQLFVCYYSMFAGTGAPQANLGYIVIYDSNGAGPVSYHTNQSTYWDATAAALRYVSNDLTMKNYWFRYLGRLDYTEVFFQGFKISY